MNLASVTRLMIGAAVAAGCSVASAQSLDYDFYKTKVEPIFYKHREGHARCVACHSDSNNSFHLQSWTPEYDGVYGRTIAREFRNALEAGE